MSEATIPLRRILRLAATVEIGTGVALMSAPAVVAGMLLRAEVTDLSSLLGRCMGIALLALGLACWPERQGPASSPAAFRAMLLYSALIALMLGYAGAFAGLAGPLLWPAVALHGTVAVLLAWNGRNRRPRG